MRRANFAGWGLGSDSPAGTSGRALGGGSERRGRRETLGPGEDLTLRFSAPFCVSPQTAGRWGNRGRPLTRGSFSQPRGRGKEEAAAAAGARVGGLR